MSILDSAKSSELIFSPLLEVGFDSMLSDRFPKSRFVILTDENVSANWMEFFITNFETLHRADIIELAPGESSKTIEICASVWEALAEYEIGRQDVIINFGGGVVSDLGGFIASTYKRGLRFVNVPTTLLAQVDASVGGKTGIDLGMLKNMIGTFAQPELVFIDPGFLKTLPAEELISGYAEIWKHGLIADATHWKEAKYSESNDISTELIRNSVSIKKKLVELDPFESGERKKLNFGHTVGHALEGSRLNSGQSLLHGQAVGLGMIAEAYISYKLGLLGEGDFSEIENRLRRYYQSYLPNEINSADLIKLMKNDKKNQQNEIRFTLLTGIGSSVFDRPVEDQLIHESLNYLSGI